MPTSVLGPTATAMPSDQDDDDDDYDDDRHLAHLLTASTRAFKLQDDRRTQAQLSQFQSNQDSISLDTAPHPISDRDMPESKVTQKSRAAAPHSAAGPSKDLDVDVHFSCLQRGENVEAEKTSAKQRRAVRSTTAGSGWFDMPAVPTVDKTKAKPGANHKAGWDSRQVTAEKMRMEISAIRLRNANDPKRFYKGGAGLRAEDMPKFAQLGKVLPSRLEPASSLARNERGRTVVEELVRDAEATSYAKRKFNEIQERNAGQRKGHHKRAKKRK